MRNWNAQDWEEGNQISPGFYFTYEELKQAMVEGLKKEGECFYFTYEELKHPR